MILPNERNLQAVLYEPVTVFRFEPAFPERPAVGPPRGAILPWLGVRLQGVSGDGAVGQKMSLAK